MDDDDAKSDDTFKRLYREQNKKAKESKKKTSLDEEKAQDEELDLLFKNFTNSKNKDEIKKDRYT